MNTAEKIAVDLMGNVLWLGYEVTGLSFVGQPPPQFQKGGYFVSKLGS